MKLFNFYFGLFGACTGGEIEYLQKDLYGMDLGPIMLIVVWGNVPLNDVVNSWSF